MHTGRMRQFLNPVIEDYYRKVIVAHVIRLNWWVSSKVDGEMNRTDGLETSQVLFQYSETDFNVRL